MKALETRASEARTRARSHKTRVHAVIPRRLYRVKSESTPGLVHSLSVQSYGATCDCHGYHYTGMCRHLGALLRRAEREGWELRIASHR